MIQVIDGKTFNDMIVNGAALIETQVIDGRKCIVIPMEGDVEINGIHVSSGNSESTES